MAALECKVAMVISRLVKFELLLELKIEQKHGTSLVKLVLSRIKSGLLQSVCPSQLYIFDIGQESAGTSHKNDCNLYPWNSGNAALSQYN
jgi:hypothetical protein